MTKFTLLLLLALPGCAYTPAPSASSRPAQRPAPRLARTPAGAIPAEWKISQADNEVVRRDFNRDGNDDLVALVYRADRSPALAAALSHDGGYYLHLLSPELGFARISAAKGGRILLLDRTTGGSSSGETFEARFRFHAGDFLLISSSYTEEGWTDGCGDHCPYERRDVNHVTGDVRETSGRGKSARRLRKKQPTAPLVRLRDFRFELLAPQG